MSPWRILVTRPEPAASQWADKLRALGYRVDTVSCMAIEPLTDSDSVQRIKNIVLDFDQYQKAIFVSRNAVCEALHWLEDYWPQWPFGVAFFAVGEATARALAQADLPVQALGRGDGAMNSEALLAEPVLQRVAGERIVIFRGRGGRALISQTLTERGARVDHCELYQRALPDEARAQLTRWLSAARPEDLVTAHSGESLTNLAVLADCAGLGGQLRRLSLLVPGERVAQLAREQGFSRVQVARNAADPAMFAAISDYAQHH